jgi:hypothetical protein
MRPPCAALMAAASSPPSQGRPALITDKWGRTLPMRPGMGKLTPSPSPPIRSPSALPPESTGRVFRSRRADKCHPPQLHPFGYAPVSEGIPSPSLTTACVRAPCHEFPCQINPFLSLPVTLPGLARHLLSEVRRRNPARRTPPWQCPANLHFLTWSGPSAGAPPVTPRLWPQSPTSSTAAKSCCAAILPGRGSACPSRLALRLTHQPLHHGRASGSCHSGAAMSCGFLPLLESRGVIEHRKKGGRLKYPAEGRERITA